jgi:hypothetical protein
MDELNWQPLHWDQKYERAEEKTETGTVYITREKATGKETGRSYWSTMEPEAHKKAILTLIQNDVGFCVSIIGPAFEGEQRQGCLDHDTFIELRTYYGMNQRWFLYLDGVLQEEYTDPSKAVDDMFALREKIECGQDMADRNFSGHAGPSMESRKRMAEEAKKPKPPPPPMPTFEVGDYVHHDYGYYGVVIKPEEGQEVPQNFTPVWFGNVDEIKVIPNRQLRKIPKPPVKNQYFMGFGTKVYE